MLRAFSVLPLLLIQAATLPAGAATNTQNPSIRFYNWCAWPVYLWEKRIDHVLKGTLAPGLNGSVTIPSSRFRSLKIDITIDENVNDGTTPAMSFQAVLPPEDLPQTLFYTLKNTAAVPFKGHTVSVGGFIRPGKGCSRMVWRDGGGVAGKEETKSCGGGDAQWLDVMFCDDQASGQAVKGTLGSM
ncbi:hypothetical protein BU23DRAFT_565053 [Bimuria novae-zelandiae CBS 107.79]|uniref:Ubiquitin 3 binding protein But2 C-terminal domain-containing protein n=1 Tax=Bimuria novae-zelandiae CBS 107.79 TaxID=1447943 RepID=A0A6A5VJY5_9PLEO|nr:hypothetical protein BU23DRAFT_565053 [Bimuria novae-zelandiae CBS 107.79]